MGSKTSTYTNSNAAFFPWCDKKDSGYFYKRIFIIIIIITLKNIFITLKKEMEEGTYVIFFFPWTFLFYLVCFSLMYTYAYRAFAIILLKIITIYPLFMVSALQLVFRVFSMQPTCYCSETLSPRRSPPFQPI